MPRFSTFFVAAGLALLACTVSADQTAYNRGVQAFRSKDYVEARRQWQTSIANGGPDEAFNNLGFLLHNGMGGDTDRDAAVELWRKGAILSVSESQLHLGQAYEEGEGIEANRSWALAWYLCASATAGKLATDDDTEKKIGQLAQQAEKKLRATMSPAEVADAERIAQQLIARYSTRLQLGKL